MIVLTRLNGVKIGVNPFAILYCEETPDTIILYNTGQKILVKEKISEIQDKFADFISKSIALGIRKEKIDFSKPPDAELI